MPGVFISNDSNDSGIHKGVPTSLSTSHKPVCLNDLVSRLSTESRLNSSGKKKKDHLHFELKNSI